MVYKIVYGQKYSENVGYRTPSLNEKLSFLFLPVKHHIIKWGICMNVLSIKGLKKKFGEKTLFEDVNVAIHKGERIGIVGSNGAGKTSFAKIIAGDLKQDMGSVVIDGPIGYLRQSIDEAEVTQPIQNTRLLIKNQKQLGIDHVQYETDSNKLSGGEKLKRSLAGIWATQPEILILDEPTNHLDLKGVEWLIRELEHFRGAILVISHDRYFLDQTVNRIVEIESGCLTDYSGNYTAYRKEKQRRYEENLHHYHIQQKEKRRIEDQLAGLSNWSEKAHNQSTKQEGYKEHYRMKAKKMDSQVKSKRKRLEKELQNNKVVEPEEEQRVRFQFESNRTHGKRIVEAKNAGKCFGERWLFRDSSFYMKHGERIGLYGENGSGKTTFLRIILEEDSLSEGEIWKSPSLRIGYLSQDVQDLPEGETVQNALDLATRDDVFRAKSTLASMGIERNRMDVPISQLSLGERTKVKLTRMLMNDYDILVLDEPTNHLDLHTREQLEETLKQFGGTILIVSHDRYFMDQICDRLLVVEGHKLRRVEMSLSEYRSQENSPSSSGQTTSEQKMLIENEISAIISEISLLMAGDPRIVALDQQLNELFEKKRAL
ncbi:MAG: ABC-F type ribosomal protection protein [Anaerobacillus sp.]